jgi:Protein of unknown function (DUF1161)
MSKDSGNVFAFLVAVVSTCHATASAQAVSCEELRAKAEATIRSNGVTAFTVEVIESTAKPQGQVVGTCERGSRQLVYSTKALGTASSSEPGRPVPTANPASEAKPKPAAVITECADGRVITAGSCKK